MALRRAKRPEGKAIGVLDFLFQGQAPVQGTTGSTTSSNVPAWLQQYTQGILSEGAAVASQPYQQFQGPTVAGQTAQQQQAASEVGALQGQYQPALQQATQLATSSANPGAIGQALNSTLPQAQNYINSSTAPTAAQINPYTNNVINQAKDQATQYWQNTLQPSINNQFTAAGQYGSSANQRAANQGAATINQNIQDTSNSALAQAYTNAQQSQLAAGQATGALGQTAGGLGYEQGVLGLQGASALGNLAQQGQQLGIQGASALDTTGGELQQNQQANLNSAQNQFNQQQQYPYQQLSYLSNLESGTATPTSTPGAQQTTTNGYAPAYSPSPLSQAIGMYTAANPTTGTAARGGRIRRRQTYARGGALSWAC